MSAVFVKDTTLLENVGGVYLPLPIPSFEHSDFYTRERTNPITVRDGGILTRPDGGLTGFVNDNTTNPTPILSAPGWASPVSNGVLARGVSQTCSFRDIFYDRIHIIPLAVDFGNITNNASRQIFLWSAYEVAVTLDSITETNFIGLTLTFNHAIPHTYPPQDFEFFTLTASIDEGNSVINGSALFSFDTGDEETLTATGRRMVLWPIPPDTGADYVEEFLFTTDIITAYSGKEQRIMMREYPETSISATYSAFYNNANVMDSVIWSWQANIYGLPLWHKPMQLTTAAQDGDLTLYVDSTESKQVLEGGVVVIYCDPLHYEAVQVDSVTSNTIVLVGGIGRDWVRGCPVYAVRTARMPKEVSGQLGSMRTTSYPIKFIFEDDEPITTSDLGTVYGDYRVFDAFTRDWQNPASETYQRNMVTASSRIGQRLYRDKSGKATVINEVSLILFSHEDIDNFKSWFYTRAGALTPFWHLSQKIDMDLVGAIQEDDPYLLVKNSGFRESYTVLDGRDYLYIKLKGSCDVAPIIAPISSIELDVDPAKEKVNLTGYTFLQDYAVSDIDFICFMGLARLESDSMQVQWLSDHVIQANFKVRMLSDGV
jgi:hypothetical protein